MQNMRSARLMVRMRADHKVSLKVMKILYHLKDCTVFTEVDHYKIKSTSLVMYKIERNMLWILLKI